MIDQPEVLVTDPQTGLDISETEFFRAAKQRRVDLLAETVARRAELDPICKRLIVEIKAFDQMLGETTPLTEFAPAPDTPPVVRRGRRPGQKPAATPRYRRGDSDRTIESIDAAATVLALDGPLHYRDIYDKVLARGVSVPGKDPAATLLARFSRDPRFRRVGQGVYTLAADP